MAAGGSRGRGGGRGKQGCKPCATSCQPHANLMPTSCQPWAAGWVAGGGAGWQQGAAGVRGRGAAGVRGRGAGCWGVWGMAWGWARGADW